MVQSLVRLAQRTDARCAAVWVCCYGAVWLTGGRMDTSEAEGSWQLASMEALDGSPIETIWRVHTQPPGWNALIAVLLRLSPFGLALSLQLVMIVCGIALCVAVCRIATALGASPAAAGLLTVLATANSQIMQGGFGFRYDLPLAALLASLAAVICSRPSWRSMIGVVVIGTAITMTRALFHPIWLAMVVLVVAVGWRGRLPRRSMAWVVVGLIPIASVGGWLLKNQAQQGMLTMSSWSGMNLLRSVEPALTDDEIAELLADGVISEVAAVGPFQSYSSYEPFMPACTPKSSAAVVSRTIKSSTPVEVPFGLYIADNFNFECYVPVYEQAGVDARALIRHHPGAWLEARAWAANNWFILSSPTAVDSRVLDGMHVVTRASLLAVPHPYQPWPWRGSDLVARGIVVGPESVMLLVLTMVLLWAGARRAPGVIRGHSDLSPEAVVVTVLSLTVAWTMAAGIGLELGEQERFRMMLDPLVVAGGGALAWRAVGARLAHLRDRSAS